MDTAPVYGSTAGPSVRHQHDDDCTVRDGECIVCGVYHGGPCPACGGRGYHREGCPEIG
jgi:hypothetical protein